MKKLITPFKKIFTLDLRSLALLRIGLGALILLDLSIRATDLKAFYSDEGILPLKALFLHNWNAWNISLHTISGLWQIQALLFLIAALFACFLMVGYKTRLSCFFCWFLLLSLHARNPLILQGGDDLLRLALFWGMFLPLGKFYSLDEMNTPKPEQKQVFNVATIGFVLQILSVYFFAALLKTSPEWKAEGTAIYYALSLDQMVLPLGKLIYPYPELLKIMTYLVWYMELLVPFLFLIPFKVSFFRKAGILALISLHTGISVTLFVGLFFLIGIVTLFGFIPEDWADKFDKVVIYFKKLMIKAYEKLGHFKNKYILLTYSLKTVWNGKNNLFPKIRNTALSVVIAYTILWNFYTTSYSLVDFNHFDVDIIGQFFKIKQKWGMFSPSVFKDDGWFILEATTYDGNIIDIGRNGLPVDYRKPKNVVSLYKNDRWRKYGENSIFKANSYMLPYYCEFMFKKWNLSNPNNRIKDLRIIYMTEKTLPNYKYVEPVRRELGYISD